MEIKAIETKYKGYRFRSRLEARWAVFFDELGLEWDYEKEGYQLKSGDWYLPDFYLRAYNLWVEVKPIIDNGNRELIVEPNVIQLAKDTDGIVLQVNGDPLEHLALLVVSDDNPIVPSKLRTADKGTHGFSVMFHTEDQMDIGSHANIAVSRDGTGTFPLKQVAKLPLVFTAPRMYSNKKSSAYKAAVKARSARFEHGETPR